MNTNTLLLCVITGDGGNDVSMIQAANVGVGIIGKVCIGLEGICSVYICR